MAASDLLDLVAAMCRQPRLSLELIRFCKKIFLLVLCGCDVTARHRHQSMLQSGIPVDQIQPYTYTHTHTNSHLD